MTARGGFGLSLSSRGRSRSSPPPAGLGGTGGEGHGRDPPTPGVFRVTRCHTRCANRGRRGTGDVWSDGAPARRGCPGAAGGRTPPRRGPLCSCAASSLPIKPSLPQTAGFASLLLVRPPPPPHRGDPAAPRGRRRRGSAPTPPSPLSPAPLRHADVRAVTSAAGRAPPGGGAGGGLRFPSPPAAVT